MNLQEFTALKAGDKIENAMSNSRGEVIEADTKGVSVRWHGVGQNGAGTIRHYSAQTTLWFHWTFAPRDCTTGPCYRDDCRRGDQCLGGDYSMIANGSPTPMEVCCPGGCQHTPCRAAGAVAC